MMETIPTQAYVAIGAIAAALIAGFFSYLNLITSKEQKVSEFRQKWIDELRQEISDFTSANVYLSIAHEEFSKKKDTNKDWVVFFSDLRETQEKVVYSFTSISLRINPMEKNKELAKINSDFLIALNEARMLFNEKDLKGARLKCNELREKAIPLLKEEWKRVKKGEPAYRISKVIAECTLAAGIAGLIVGGVILYQMKMNIPHSVISQQSEQPKYSDLVRDKNLQQVKPTTPTNAKKTK